MIPFMINYSSNVVIFSIQRNVKHGSFCISNRDNLTKPTGGTDRMPHGSPNSYAAYTNANVNAAGIQLRYQIYHTPALINVQQRRVGRPDATDSELGRYFYPSDHIRAIRYVKTSMSDHHHWDYNSLRHGTTNISSSNTGRITEMGDSAE